MKLESLVKGIVGKVYDVYLYLNPYDGRWPEHWDNKKRWQKEKVCMQNYVLDKFKKYRLI